MDSPLIKVYKDPESLSRGVAKRIAILLKRGIEKRGIFTIALSGGQTPLHLYRLLAREYRDKIPWSSIHFFWGDERYLPAGQRESNFLMAYEALLSKVSVPFKNIHRIPTDIYPVRDAAERYESILREFFQSSFHGEKDYPSLDLILLGVGKDGHTASLFPGTPALNEDKRWVIETLSPVPPYHRITMTLPLINKGRHIFFLVTGREKREIVGSILKRKGAERLYPAAMVHGRDKTIWFLDREALGREIVSEI